MFTFLNSIFFSLFTVKTKNIKENSLYVKTYNKAFLILKKHCNEVLKKESEWRKEKGLLISKWFVMKLVDERLQPWAAARWIPSLSPDTVVGVRWWDDEADELRRLGGDGKVEEHEMDNSNKKFIHSESVSSVSRD